MGLMGCLGCEGQYEIGLERCPQCGTRSPMYQGTEGEDGMPKITVSGGASNAAADLEATAAEAEAVAPVEEAAPAAVLVGEPGPELVDLPAGDVVAAPKAARRKAAPSAPDAPAEGE